MSLEKSEIVGVLAWWPAHQPPLSLTDLPPRDVHRRAGELGDAIGADKNSEICSNSGRVIGCLYSIDIGVAITRVYPPPGPKPPARQK